MAEPTKKLLCIGMGYVAKALAGTLATSGYAIAGTARTPERLASLGEMGAEALVFNGTEPSPQLAAVLEQATHLLISAPPGEDGDPVLAHHGRDIASAGRLAWIGYLSTTGVYGDRDGDWVDETTVPAPGNPTSQRRLDAEADWLTFGAVNGIPTEIFRLAGIYGPGRSALDQLRAGRARRIAKPGQVFSRVHVDDIAAVLRAAIAAPVAGAIFNVCDDEPAAQSDVVAHAAGLLGIEPPPEEPFETARMSDAMRRFYSENRRVRNARIKSELGVRLRYPTYREGLAALAAEAG